MKINSKTIGRTEVVPKVLVDAATIYGVHHKSNHKKLAPLSKGDSVSVVDNSETIERNGADDVMDGDGIDNYASQEMNAPARDVRSRESRGKSAKAAPLIASASSSYDFKTGEMTLRSGGGAIGGTEDGVAMFAGISLDGVGRATPLTAEQRSRPHHRTRAADDDNSVNAAAVNVQNVLNLSLASNNDERHQIHAEGSDWLD
jgi:hypothetical protein